jgi:hypothetical protein
MNTNVTVEELRKLSSEARTRQRQKKVQQEKLQEERDARALAMEKIKAQDVVSKIRQRCETQADAGLEYAIVMSLGEQDYELNRPGVPNKLDPDALAENRAGKMVYDVCREAGLAPTLEHWHDGIGMRGGFNIVVHW